MIGSTDQQLEPLLVSRARAPSPICFAQKIAASVRRRNAAGIYIGSGAARLLLTDGGPIHGDFGGGQCDTQPAPAFRKEQWIRRESIAGISGKGRTKLEYGSAFACVTTSPSNGCAACTCSILYILGSVAGTRFDAAVGTPDIAQEWVVPFLTDGTIDLPRIGYGMVVAADSR